MRLLDEWPRPRPAEQPQANTNPNEAGQAIQETIQTVADSVQSVSAKPPEIAENLLENQPPL